MADGGQAVEYLSVVVFEKLVGDVSRGAVTTLKMSGENFNLVSLKGLHTFVDDTPSLTDEVTTVDVQGNQLTSIVELAVFKRLKVILASRNDMKFFCSTAKLPSATSWPFRMDRLLELDLSFNKLSSIPDLKSMPNLKQLNLHHNRITAPWAQLRNGKNLEVLDLSANNIDFAPKDFNKEAKVLRSLSRLRELFLVDNPIVSSVPDYYIVCVNQIRQGSRLALIKRVDEYTINKDVKDLADGSKASSAPSDQKESNGLDSILKKKQTATPGGGGGATAATDNNASGLVPNLNILNSRLEECFSHPSDCLKYISLLTTDVHAILSSKTGQKFLFHPFPIDATSDTLRNEYIQTSLEEFLQNIILLAERQPQVLQPLLRVLAYLSGVQVQSVSVRCLQQLEDLLSADESHANEVVKVINECLVPQLKKSKNLEARISICKSLTKLAQDAEMPEVLTELIPTIVKWLHKPSKSNSSQSSSGIPKDDAIAMAAIASKAERNAVEMGDCRIFIHIGEEFELCPKFTSRYLDLLSVISNLSRHDIYHTQTSVDDLKDESRIYVSKKSARNYIHRSASYFVHVGLQRQILSDLRTLIEDQRDIKSSSKLTCIASAIDCIATISLEKDGIQDLLNPTRSYLKLLFAIYNIPRIRPDILSAVFRALYELLNAPVEWFPLKYGNEVEITKYNVLEEITRRLSGVVPLLQYLGESGTRYAECCVALGDGIRIPRLSELTSPVMLKLLESIIDIIAFYCNAANDTKNKLAQQVGAYLNDGNREGYLFACLNCPSDSVRLAVVRCLLEVPLHELDNTEVAHLVQMVGEVTNVASGQTEEVLGGSLELLTKLCLSDTETGSAFRINNGPQAALAAFHILRKNEMRDTRGLVIETHQKYILSKACIQFIQACSLFDELRPVLINHEMLEILSRILYLEDQASRHCKLHPTNVKELERSSHLPVVIEETWCGRQVEYLLQALLGKHGVNPLGCVAPRVLRRIADVLMGIPDPKLQDIRIFWQRDSNDDLMEQIEESDELADDLNHDELDNIPNDDDDNDIVISNGNLDEVNYNKKEEEEYFFDKIKNAASTLDNNSSHHDKWIQSIIYDMSNPHLDPVQVAARNKYRDRIMPHSWTLESFGGDYILNELKYEDAMDKPDRLKQHSVFLQFRGLERLLFYLAGAVESDAHSNVSSQLEKNAESTVASSVNLRDSFVDYTAAEEFVLSAVARAKATEESMQVMGQYRATLPTDSDFPNPIDEQPQDENKYAELSGKEILLRTFMTGSLENSKDSNDMESNIMNDVDEVVISSDSSLTPWTVSCENESDITEVLSAGLRVIYSVFHYGSEESRISSIAILRNPQRLAMLAAMCAGTKKKPIWNQALIGAKFMAICYEVLAMPSIRRQEATTTLRLYLIVTQVARRILPTLYQKIRLYGKLTSDDDILSAYTTRTLALIIKQFEYIVLPDSENFSKNVKQVAMEAIWNAIIPESILKSCLTLLLFDMQRDNKILRSKLDKNENDEARRVTKNDGSDFDDDLTYDKFYVQDAIRHYVTVFLTQCLKNSPSARYGVLEEIMRARNLDKCPIRDSYIQELLAKVADETFQEKLAQLLVEEQYHLSNKSFSLSTTRKSSTNIFSFCTGGGRNEESLQSEGSLTHQANKRWNVRPPQPPSGNLIKDLASQQDSSALVGNRFSWELERIGKEKIIVQSIVDITEGNGNNKRCILVLTSEAYYLIDLPSKDVGWGGSSEDVVLEQYASLKYQIISRAVDDLVNGRKSEYHLLWRKPYRALERIVLGVTKQYLFINHRSCDNPASEATPVMMKVLTYIDSTAELMYRTFLTMSSIWSDIEVTLGADPSSVCEIEAEPDKPFIVSLNYLINKHTFDDLQLIKNDADGLGYKSIVKFMSLVLFAELKKDGTLKSKDKSKRAYKEALIVLTGSKFIILDVDYSKWSFPRNFQKELEDFKLVLKSADRVDNQFDKYGNQQPNPTIELSYNNKKAELEASEKVERAKYDKMLSLNSPAKHMQMLSDLFEISFDENETPGMSVSFGRTKPKGNKLQLLTNNAVVHAKHLFHFVFHDDDSHAQCRRAFAPSIANMIKKTDTAAKF